MRPKAKQKSRVVCGAVVCGALKRGSIQERKDNLGYLERQAARVQDAFDNASLIADPDDDKLSLPRFVIKKKLVWYNRQVRREKEMLVAQQTREAMEVDRACLAKTKPQSREFAKGWLANDRRREQQKQKVIQVADTGKRPAKNILGVFHNREQPQKRRKSPGSSQPPSSNKSPRQVRLRQ